jgi:hypothetical protein
VAFCLERNKTMYRMQLRWSTIMKSLLLTPFTCLGLIALVLSTAWADPLIFDGVDNCTTTNCGAVFLNGISQRNAFGDSVPFVAQLFADVNQCMRLDVPSQTADREIVLISPSGAIWRNDDFNSLRPLIMARADVKGYYTGQINYYNGAQPLDTVQLFTLAYGLYAPNTPNNCPSPTTPSFTPVATESQK